MRTARRERLLARIEKRKHPLPQPEPTLLGFLADELKTMPDDASDVEQFMRFTRALHRETAFKDITPLGIVEAGLSLNWLQSDHRAEALEFVKQALDEGWLGEQSEEDSE